MKENKLTLCQRLDYGTNRICVNMRQLFNCGVLSLILCTFTVLYMHVYFILLIY